MFDYTMKTTYTNLMPMQVLVHPSLLWQCTQPNRQGQDMFLLPLKLMHKFYQASVYNFLGDELRKPATCKHFKHHKCKSTKYSLIPSIEKDYDSFSNKLLSSKCYPFVKVNV